jgi:hypothetical protein
MAVIMWWKGQHLSEPRKDRQGCIWHFRVWHGSANSVYVQRIFFWNDGKSETGVLELTGCNLKHVSRIRQIMQKILLKPDYRAKYHRSLAFPVERNYATYVPFDGNAESR